MSIRFHVTLSATAIVLSSLAVPAATTQAQSCLSDIISKGAFANSSLFSRFAAPNADPANCAQQNADSGSGRNAATNITGNTRNQTGPNADGAPAFDFGTFTIPKAPNLPASLGFTSILDVDPRTRFRR